MKKLLVVFLSLLLNTNVTNDTKQATLLPDSVVAALSQELSGETAKSNLEFIARQHRMRGSRGFRAAADHIVKQLHEYALTDARVEQFPADGKIFYGTQKSRPPWDIITVRNVRARFDCYSFKDSAVRVKSMLMKF